MKRILSILLVLSLLLPVFALADEAPEEERAEGCVYMEDYPSRRVTFTYPTECETRAERSAGFFNVYYDDYQYVAVWLYPSSKERLESFTYAYRGQTVLVDGAQYTNLYILSDQICAGGCLCDPVYDPIAIDFLEIGITLDNGYDIMVQSACYSGQVTGCYDLYLDILGNFIDTELVESWLNEVWYPQVLALAEEDQ